MTIVEERALILPSAKYGAPPCVRLPGGEEGLTLQPRSGRAHSGGRFAMYKRIVLAVDLAEPTPHPKGLEQALELAKMSGGLLRLVNVQPVVPATFMEYVPVDFDLEQAK